MTHRVKDNLLYCPRCNEYRQFDCFYKHSQRPDGYAAYCKECEKIYPPRKDTGQGQKKGPKNKFGKNPRKITQLVSNETTLIKCYGPCKQMKSISDFHKHAKNTRGCSNYCKECAIKHTHKYRGTSPTGKRYRRKDEFGNLLCSKCHQFKPPESYKYNSSTVDKKTSQCNDCYRLQRPLKTRVRIITETSAECRICWRALPLDNFYRTKLHIDSKCHQCRAIIAQQKREKRPKKEKKLSTWRYNTYRKRAAEDGREFQISLEQFHSIINMPCAYCGNTKRIGVDRVDNTRGYLLDNCAACCALCNFIKRNLTLAQMKEHITKMLNYMSVAAS